MIIPEHLLKVRSWEDVERALREIAHNGVDSQQALSIAVDVYNRGGDISSNAGTPLPDSGRRLREVPRVVIPENADVNFNMNRGVAVPSVTARRTKRLERG